MEPKEERDVEEAGLPESEDAETEERGGWSETETPPHEGEEGQDIV